MAADDLATQVARASATSAAMVLTKSYQYILATAQGGLIINTMQVVEFYPKKIQIK